MQWNEIKTNKRQTLRLQCWWFIFNLLFNLSLDFLGWAPHLLLLAWHLQKKMWGLIRWEPLRFRVHLASVDSVVLCAGWAVPSWVRMPGEAEPGSDGEAGSGAGGRCSVPGAGHRGHSGALTGPGGRGCRSLLRLDRLRQTGAARPTREEDDQLHSSWHCRGISISQVTISCSPQGDSHHLFCTALCHCH